MCGIVGFLDRRGRAGFPAGRVILDMLEALACRGPDGAGVALLREPRDEGAWNARLTGVSLAEAEEAQLALGTGDDLVLFEGDSYRLTVRTAAGLSPGDAERVAGARPGGPEVLCLGERLDLVKQVGSPSELERAYGVSAWRGPLGIGHTRMSTESRIDLSHSQPFWAHGLVDVATVHNGHVTNYHQLRRRYEQRGVTFYTDNDSEVIGVYLRDRLDRGRTLPEALADSVGDLDGAFNYLVLSPEGLGVVRDRHGFKPLMVAETADFVAVATEEVALRRALAGSYRAAEPPPGCVAFYPLPAAVAV